MSAALMALTADTAEDCAIYSVFILEIVKREDTVPALVFYLLDLIAVDTPDLILP